MLLSFITMASSGTFCAAVVFTAVVGALVVGTVAGANVVGSCVVNTPVAVCAAAGTVLSAVSPLFFTVTSTTVTTIANTTTTAKAIKIGALCSLNQSESFAFIS